MVSGDCTSPFIFNIFRYGLALFYLGSLFIVIGYHNPWISFIRYIGLSMITLGVACLVVSTIHGIIRFICQNHVNDLGEIGRSQHNNNSNSNHGHLRESNTYLYSQGGKAGLPNYDSVVDKGLPTYDEAIALPLNPMFLLSDSAFNDISDISKKKKNRRKSTDFKEDRRPVSLIGTYRRPIGSRDLHGVEAQNESRSNFSSPILWRNQENPPMSTQMQETRMEIPVATVMERSPFNYSSSSFESLSDTEQPHNSNDGVPGPSRRHSLSFVSEGVSPSHLYSSTTHHQHHVNEELPRSKSHRAKTASFIYHR